MQAVYFSMAVNLLAAIYYFSGSISAYGVVDTLGSVPSHFYILDYLHRFTGLGSHLHFRYRMAV